MASARVVPLRVCMAIDVIVDRRSMTFSKSPKHWEALQHVDVVVRSGQAKESMPNSEVVMFHSLKYHAALSSVAFVHSLPRKWAILPTPMHVVDASKHTSHILCQYLRCVFDTSQTYL
jgi:hypothetical protein